MELVYPCKCIIEVKNGRWSPPFDTDIKRLCEEHKTAIQTDFESYMDKVVFEAEGRLQQYLERLLK